MDKTDKHFSKVEDFINEFYRILNQFVTHRDAYECLEIRHEKRYGFRKYKSYDSFKVMKSRKLKSV